MLDETIIDDLIGNLMEVMRRDEINAVGYLDETMSSNVLAQLQAAKTIQIVQVQQQEKQ